MNTKELKHNNSPEQTMEEFIRKEQKRLLNMDPWERRRVAEEIAIATVSA